MNQTEPNLIKPNEAATRKKRCVCLACTRWPFLAFHQYREVLNYKCLTNAPPAVLCTTDDIEGADDHIQSIRGQNKSKWLSKCCVKTVPVPVYIDDQEQIDSIICALAFVDNLSNLEAEEKFLKGPVIHLSEREHFDKRIEQHFRLASLRLISVCH